MLATALLQSAKRVIVVDPKHRFAGDGYKRDFHLRPWWDKFRVVWRPGKGDDARLNELLHRAFRAGDVIIYCDELKTATEFFPESTANLQDIIRTGREAGVSVWTAFQRPRTIDLYFLSETSHRFIFTLADEYDRRRAAEVIGDDAIEKIPFHTFLYSNDSLENPVLMRYDPESGKFQRGARDGTLR